MKKTQKYAKACERLTVPHSTQDQLYQELIKLGWYWDSKKKEWERDDRLPTDEPKLIKIRIRGVPKKAAQAADVLVENGENLGLRFLDRSEPYILRPPNQNEVHVYLTFEDVEIESELN